MALLSLQNAVILVGQANLSGQSNMIDLTVEADEKDVTTFGDNGFKAVRAGIKSTMFKIEGFWDAGNAGLPDDRMFGDLGVAGVPMTVGPTGPTVGETAYLSRVARLSYAFGDVVGEIAPFSSEAQTDGTVLGRGKFVDNQARTATGTTAAQLIAAPAAGQRVVAAIHVISATGTTPSLTATLQSDDAVGFPSPATVATGTAITAAGSQWLQGPPGAATDTYYRLSYVVSGTSPNFTVIAAIGIG